MKVFFAFLQDEGGLVTIEWVGLAAGVVVLSIGVAATISGSAVSAASTVGSGVESTVSSTLANGG